MAIEAPNEQQINDGVPGSVDSMGPSKSFHDDPAYQEFVRRMNEPDSWGRFAKETLIELAKAVPTALVAIALMCTSIYTGYDLAIRSNAPYSQVMGDKIIAESDTMKRLRVKAAEYEDRQILQGNTSKANDFSLLGLAHHTQRLIEDPMAYVTMAWRNITYAPFEGGRFTDVFTPQEMIIPKGIAGLGLRAFDFKTEKDQHIYTAALSLEGKRYRVFKPWHEYGTSIAPTQFQWENGDTRKDELWWAANNPRNAHSNGYSYSIYDEHGALAEGAGWMNSFLPGYDLATMTKFLNGDQLTQTYGAVYPNSGAIPATGYTEIKNGGVVIENFPIGGDEAKFMRLKNGQGVTFLTTDEYEKDITQPQKIGDATYLQIAWFEDITKYVQKMPLSQLDVSKIQSDYDMVNNNPESPAADASSRTSKYTLVATMTDGKQYYVDIARYLGEKKDISLGYQLAAGIQTLQEIAPKNEIVQKLVLSGTGAQGSTATIQAYPNKQKLSDLPQDVSREGKPVFETLDELITYYKNKEIEFPKPPQKGMVAK